jgi:hypothetical protein
MITIEPILGTRPEGSFLNGFSCLREKLALTPVLDLAFLVPMRELAPTDVLKKLPSEASFLKRSWHLRKSWRLWKSWRLRKSKRRRKRQA